MLDLTPQNTEATIKKFNNSFLLRLSLNIISVVVASKQVSIPLTRKKKISTDVM